MYADPELLDQGMNENQASRAPNRKARAVRASIWLGNLRRDLTRPELTGAIASLFSVPINYHGPSPNDPMHRCYAILDFATVEEALELLRHCGAPQNQRSNKALKLTRMIGGMDLPVIEAKVTEMSIDLTGHKPVIVGPDDQFMAWLKIETPEMPPSEMCIPDACTPQEPRLGRQQELNQYKTAKCHHPRDHFSRDSVRHDRNLWGYDGHARNRTVPVCW